MRKNLRRLALKKEFLLLIFLTQTLRAQTSSTSTSVVEPSHDSRQSEISRNSIALPSAERTSVFGQIRFESLQYLTKLEEAPELSTSQFLSGRVTAASFVRDQGRINWAADISAGTFFSLKQSYYSVQEIYISTPLDDRANLSLGRKKYDWSEIDRVWAFGLWQPRYNIDALRPEDQGLTGLFFDYTSGNFQILAFASSVFIPTMGPDIREEDGQLKADSRWYRPPSSQSGKISLSYDIKTGDIMDLVRQESYSLKVRVGKEEEGPWMSVAAGRKPINDVLYERLVRGVNADSTSKFVVSPRVTHHRAASADIGYQTESWNTSVSYFEDQPETILPREDYAVQKYEPIKVYSAQVEWDIREFLNRSFHMRLAYLKSFGGGIQDIESSGQASEITLFTTRYKFSNAANLQVLSEVATLFSRPLVSKFEFTREFDQKGSIMGLEFQYQWNRSWSYLAGFDTLSVDDDKSTSDGFVNVYRANDRIYAGASYVF